MYRYRTPDADSASTGVAYLTGADGATTTIEGLASPKMWTIREFEGFTQTLIKESAKVITAITQAGPGVVTSTAHGYSTGDIVYLSSIGGMTQLNGRYVTVTVLTADTYSIGLNTTTYGVYTSGGTSQREVLGTTFDITFDTVPANFDPTTEQLTIRCVGRNDTNNMLPQVDGTWSVTVTEDSSKSTNNRDRFTITGSTYGVMTNAGGVAYVPGTLIDASPRSAKIATWLRTHGGGTADFAGRFGMYLKSSPFYLDNNSTYNFNNCFSLKADRIDQPTQFNQSFTTGVPTAPLNKNVSKLQVFDLWVFDNRGYQVYQAGQHAMGMGSSTDSTRWGQHVELIRVHVRAAAGYGGSMQNGNVWVNFKKQHGSVKWCDGDTWDRKNTLSRNDAYHLFDEDHEWPAQGDMGTNLIMERGLSNPLRSLSIGTDVVRVTWNAHKWRTGDRVIITQTVAGNGITIPSTPLTVTVTDGNLFTVVASGSSLANAAFGGSTVQIRKCVAVDGITTVLGQTYLQLARDTDSATRIGEKVTLSGGGTVGGINTEGVWDVIYVAGVLIRLDRIDPDTGTSTGTVATSSVSGGGSSITYVCPHLSVGDRVEDQRQARTSIRDLRVRMEAFHRTGLQGRGGEVGDSNGLGANYMVVDGYHFVDLTPKWIGTLGAGGQGMAMAGKGVMISNAHIKGLGLGTGIALSTTSDSCQLEEFTIEEAQTGIQLRGDRALIGRGRILNTVQRGISVWGYLETVARDLPDDCFQPFAVGDSRVIIYDPIDTTAIPPDPGNPIVPGVFKTISNITQANPAVVTTTTGHGMSTGTKIGLEQIVGMTELNGRVAVITSLTGTTFSLAYGPDGTTPIDSTAFGAYVSGGMLTNKKVRFSGNTGGSPQLVPSNVGQYTAIYISTETYYIDALENIAGPSALANSTTPFGLHSIARYGTLPHTAQNTTIDGVEFQHDDPANTATVIENGAEINVGVADRGRSDGTIIRNVRNAGYATGKVNYGTNVLFAPSNIGIDSSVPYASLMAAATAGEGARATVSDSTTAVFLAAIAGGGANVVPAVVSGGVWRVG